MSHRNRAIVGYGSQAEVNSGARSGRRRRANEAEEEEDGEEGGGGRGAASGRGAAARENIGLSASELESLISTATRFVVSHQGKTVQRVEIHKFLMDEHNISKAAFAAIMSGVEKRLDETMGFKLVEMDKNCFMVYNPYTLAEINMDFSLGQDEEGDQEERNLTFRPNSAAQRRQRRMVNGHGRGRAVQDDEEEEDEEDEEDEEGENISPEDLLDHTRKGLLLIVLANLYMNEEPMPETELLECLKMAGIDPEAKISDCDIEEKLTIKKLVLDELRIAGYLKRTKVTSNGEENAPTYHIVSWGYRAWVEFSPTDVVDFVKNVYKTVGGQSGPEAELRWERMSKRLAKDEKARETLIKRGQVAFDEMVVQKRQDLDGVGQPPPRAVQNGRRGRRGGEEDVDDVEEVAQPRGRSRGRAAGRAGGSVSPAEEEEEEEEEVVEVRPAPKRGRAQPKKSGGGGGNVTTTRISRSRTLNGHDEEEEEVVGETSRRGRSRKK